MIHVWTSLQFNQERFDFNRWVDSLSSLDLLDDTFFETPPLVGETDGAINFSVPSVTLIDIFLARFDLLDAVAGFGGGNLTVDQDNMPSGGTATYFEESNQLTGEYLRIQGFTIPLVDAWAAALTNGVTDDSQILAAIFSAPLRAHLSDASDVLFGGAFDDSVRGADGDDLLRGKAGGDRLFGGLGNDSLEGGLGSDVLTGSDGDDVLLGGSSDDQLFGGEGNDVVDGGDNADRMAGNAGDDTLRGG